MTYAEKLTDPRWQKMRLRILERDKFTCRNCGDAESTLHIHHKIYRKNCDPWEYEESDLITLCETCHEFEKEAISNNINCLMQLAKKNFLADDISSLCIGFDNMCHPHLPCVTASIIGWAISNREVMEELKDKYFEHLEKIRKMNNASRE